jgi:hypothetical protein
MCVPKEKDKRTNNDLHSDLENFKKIIEMLHVLKNMKNVKSPGLDG